jgi:hypothetical protein
VKPWHVVTAWVGASLPVGVLCGTWLRRAGGPEPMPPEPIPDAEALDRLDAMLADLVSCRPENPCTIHARAVFDAGRCPGLCCDHCVTY